jgi:Transglutaminase-like superfamily
MIIRAYALLMVFDFYLTRRHFESFIEKLRTYPVSERKPEADVLSRVYEAVAMARIWYWKKLPSFVVTAATVCLLRHYGEPAEMVIGAPQRPFEQHVWIEVGGSVVNERRYARGKGLSIARL